MVAFEEQITPEQVSDETNDSPEAAEVVPTDVIDRSVKQWVQMASDELERVLHMTRPKTSDYLENQLSHKILHIVDAIEKSALNPGFAGLKEVRKEVAQELAHTWRQELLRQKERKEFSGKVPQAFIVRSLPDGGLFLEPFDLPDGVVMPSAPKMTSYYEDHVVEQEVIPTVMPSVLRSIIINEDGTATVSGGKS